MHQLNLCNLVVLPLQRFTARGAVLACLVMVIAFSTAANATAQEDLTGFFQKAATGFQPVPEKAVADARANLDSSMKDVERFVSPSSENSKRWLKYLRWDDLQKALANKEKTDFRPLNTTYQRLNRDENGLELSQFRKLASALQRYMQLAQIAQQPDQQKYYAAQLDRLKTQLDEYRAKPSDATSVEIGGRIAFIEALNTSPELVAAVRKEFGKPNAYMDISTALIAAGAEPISRNEPVHDCILGTSINSDAFTTGNVSVATIPSTDRAVIEFTSEGHTFSHNVGHNGPAVIRSTADTDFTASKRVSLTDKAFTASSSNANATTDTHIHSIAKSGGGLGSGLVSRIGWSRARQSEHQAERIASDHAEDRINRNFNDELDDHVSKAREQYEDGYRRPLERRGEVPSHIVFSSDKDSVNLELAQATSSQLAAPGTPPEAPGGHDMAMRLHDSAVNNYSASLIGGATASETEPGQDVKFDVKMPDWMKNAWKDRKTEGAAPADANAQFKPWSLKFRDVRPLTVNFIENKVNVTVHIARLKSGDNTFNNWDVTGTYVPELLHGGVKLHREGDLVMLPANFSGQLSPRQVAERRNLEAELNARSAQGHGFPMTIEFQSLKPTGALADAGPLEYNQFSSDNGWLTLAWDRQKKPRR